MSAGLTDTVECEECRKRWRVCLTSILETNRWPECCGEVMRLLPPAEEGLKSKPLYRRPRWSERNPELKREADRLSQRRLRAARKLERSPRPS